VQPTPCGLAGFGRSRVRKSKLASQHRAANANRWALAQ